MKIGLITERKSPPDRRVAFLPEQCVEISQKFPVSFKVEPSQVRCLPDEVYLSMGLNVTSDLSDCDVLFGIKEVPVEALMPEKTYLFFSHTIKKQPHNQKLLQAVLQKNIRLIDYECLTDDQGNRTVAFGRFAGIVGAYNGFRMWMQRAHQTPLKPAFECGDMEEMLDYARHHLATLGPIKIVITGTGRVGKGAKEVLDALGIAQVEPEDFLIQTYNKPVYTVLSSRHYYHHVEKEGWDEDHFRQHPEQYRSHFNSFAACTDLFISCHFWNPKAEPLFRAEHLLEPDFRIKVISDVTCDLDGSIPTTLRTSSIASPFYDVNPKTMSEEAAFSSDENITVCAVDNLPCELPYDASLAFGKMLEKHVIPELFSAQSDVLDRATIASKGKLMPRFAYLQDYADGKLETKVVFNPFD